MSRHLHLVIATILALAATGAQAHGGHEGSAPGSYSFGTPAEPSAAIRTIAIEAMDDKFSPNEVTIKKGETIAFVITNTGRHVHDFNIGDLPAQRAHAQMMEQMPDMHDDDDPTARTLDKGEVKTIAWTFDKTPADPIELACLETGHYEKGMYVKVNLVP